jgi:hypothetical protein
MLVARPNELLISCDQPRDRTFDGQPQEQS